MHALGYPADFFRAELVQLVRVMRGGEEVRLEKRTGEFVSLRDLVQETGVDAARYFFLMRRGDSQFVFDVDLAKSQKDENPVYYVQMAHARMSGIFKVAARDPASVTPVAADSSVLTQPEEIDLMKELAAFPGVVARAAETLEPHRVTGYLEGLARIAHAWYQVPRAGRARGAGAPGPRGGGATGAGERAAPARHHGAGADVTAGLLVVGSIALDSVATPFGETADAPGGSAVFFSAAGAILHPVQVVGVVGSDYPLGALKALEARGVDLAGVEQMPGESFRWKAKYSYDLSSRETLDTRLGVFAQFRPKLPPKFRDARYLFLGNIDPELQLGVLDQVKSPALVACDTMNYWIHSKRDLLLELLRHIDILLVNDSEARENVDVAQQLE